MLANHEEETSRLREQLRAANEREQQAIALLQERSAQIQALQQAGREKDSALENAARETDAQALEYATLASKYMEMKTRFVEQ